MDVASINKIHRGKMSRQLSIQESASIADDDCGNSLPRSDVCDHLVLLQHIRNIHMYHKMAANWLWQKEGERRRKILYDDSTCVMRKL